MWKDYPVPGGTLRENMHCKPGQSRLPEEHPAAVYRRERLDKRKQRDLAFATSGTPVNGVAANRVCTSSISEAVVTTNGVASNEISA